MITESCSTFILFCTSQYAILARLVLLPTPFTPTNTITYGLPLQHSKVCARLDPNWWIQCSDKPSLAFKMNVCVCMWCKQYIQAQTIHAAASKCVPAPCCLSLPEYINGTLRRQDTSNGLLNCSAHSRGDSCEGAQLLAHQCSSHRLTQPACSTCT